MANTTKIVYVTQAQYNSLITTGSVTVGGVTYTYDANNTYLVREDGIEGDSVLSTGASNSQVLTADGNGGATWQGLYLHTIYAHQATDTNTVEIRICFEIISTQSTAYGGVSEIPAGRYLAVGYVDGTSFNEGACRTLYLDRPSNGTRGIVHYLIGDNSGEQQAPLYNSNTTLTDTVTQIL